MKRSLWIALSVVLVIAILLAAKPAVENLIKTEIIEAVKNECDDCVIAMKSVTLKVANPGEIALNDLRFVAGQGGRSLVEARFEKLVIDVALTKSSRDKVIVNRVEGFGPDIIYADGDAPEIKSPEKPPGKKFEFEILETRLNQGNFRYAHTQHKKTSILHIHDIDASMSPIGNTPVARERMTTAKLSGQIEKSGRGTLDLAALVRRGPWYVDAVLEISDQNLADLNTFFTPNDHIELKGIVNHAVAKLNVRDDMTKANVEAVYRDADYKEHASEDRSGIEAALANIGSAIMMTKTNVDFPPQQQRAEIEVKLEPDEPLVHYMLRSAKLGLLEVAKKKKNER